MYVDLWSRLSKEYLLSNVFTWYMQATYLTPGHQGFLVLSQSAWTGFEFEQGLEVTATVAIVIMS